MPNADLDEIKVINLDTGAEFTSWTSATMQSDFLTPCDSFQLDCGAEIAGTELAKQLRAGTKIQIFINEQPQLTGYVDRTQVQSCRGGTRVSISGRDFLGQLVDSNVDPRMQIAKDASIETILKTVLTDQFGIEYELKTNYDARSICTGKKIGQKKNYTGRRSRKDPLKNVQPQDNEGAFGYLSKILTAHGYWLWAMPDGTGVVVSGPDYTQKPAFTLTTRYSLNANEKTAQNNVIEGTAHNDETNVPSHVIVRGQGGPGGKAAIKGMAMNPVASRFRPVYIVNQTDDKLSAETRAKLFLAKQLRNWFHYECTVAGFSQNGTIWAVDTVATVLDEICGVEGLMWVESRTFSKSRSSGTTTKLKLIPLGSLVLDYQPDENITVPAAYGPLNADFKLNKPTEPIIGLYGIQFYQDFNKQ